VAIFYDALSIPKTYSTERNVEIGTRGGNHDENFWAFPRSDYHSLFSERCSTELKLAGLYILSCEQTI